MTMWRRLFGWLIPGGSEAPPAPAPEPLGAIPVIAAGEASHGLPGTLTARDWSRLAGVHPDLVQIVARARSAFPFFVIEGRRSAERQRELVAKGLSKTMNSRHLVGLAVDFAPLLDDGSITWKWPAFPPVANAFKQAAKELKIPIEWGGDFRTFKDGPHIQLSHKVYK
jgi:peptidoglycan L-alanyl-D-glutamate endopeptidase CwlK